MENHDQTVTKKEYKKIFSEKDLMMEEAKYNSDKNLAEEEATQENQSEVRKKTIIGVVIVVLLAVSWVGAQQFSQTAVNMEDFNAPYFATWFSTCWMTLCYPIYCIFLALSSAIQGDTGNFRKQIYNSQKVFGTPKITWRLFFTRIVTMNILWILVNYAYLYGLQYIAATDASAIMASNVAFVYILSLFLLKENFYAIRLIASVFCISGILLISYADGFSGGTLIGVLLALGSAIGAAIYKVIFKVLVGEATLGQVSLFLSLLGFSNVIFLWILFLILYLTGVDTMVAATIPWMYLCVSAILGVIFNFLVNFGIAFTYPLFISIAMMVGVPLNAAVDVLIKDVTFNAWRLVGALVIIIGFGLMLLPDDWNTPIHRAFGCNCKDRRRVDVDIVDEKVEGDEEVQEENKL